MIRDFLFLARGFPNRSGSLETAVRQDVDSVSRRALLAKSIGDDVADGIFECQSGFGDRSGEAGVG